VWCPNRSGSRGGDALRAMLQVRDGIVLQDSSLLCLDRLYGPEIRRRWEESQGGLGKQAHGWVGGLVKQAPGAEIGWSERERERERGECV
jgi:hypothetical protein